MLEGQRMRAAESSKRITVEGVIEELKQGRLSPPTAEALKHALLNEPIEWVKSLLDKGLFLCRFLILLLNYYSFFFFFFFFFENNLPFL